MKRLVLIKQFYSTDVAHLYEHLFCMAVSKLFIEKELFQYVDYSLVGKTNHPGIIVIDLELYSKDAIFLSDELKSLNIKFSKRHIMNSLIQVYAEEEKPLFISDFDTLKEELTALSDIKWETADEFGVYDATNVSDSEGSFYVAVGNPEPATVLSIAVGIDQDFVNNNKILLPLFHEISRIVIDNIQIPLAYTFGYYSFSDEFKKIENTIQLINNFKIANSELSGFDLVKTIEFCQDISRRMLSLGVFERYVKMLHSVLLFNTPNLAPNLENIYNNTHILIGSSGWNKVANLTNMQLVLDHMYLELGLKSQTATRVPLNKL